MSYLTEDEQREREKEEKRRQSRQQIIEHIRKPLLFTVFDVQWVPSSASCIALGHYANNQGAISMYTMNAGELRTEHEIRKDLPFKCGTFGHCYNGCSPSTEGQRTMATGDFGGNLQIWSVERAFDKPTFEVRKAHDSIINAIDGALHEGPPEIVTGSRDGAVKLWDPRQKEKPVVALNPVDKGRARDCWTVRLGNSHTSEDRVIAAGYDNGDVKLFDLRASKMLHEFNVSNGVCDLEFDRPNIELNKLIVSSLEGRVRAYDLRTLNPELGYAYVEERVSTGTIWCSKALPQNREIFMSGGAGELTLSKYEYPPERSLKDDKGMPKGVAGTIQELNKVKVGDQPINALAWHKQREGLMVCGAFDQTLRVMLVTKLSSL